MDAGLRDAIAAAVGAAVLDVRPLGGGDINLAYAVKLVDGRNVFVKTARDPRAAPQMFPAEARGLDWLRQARALRIPSVIASDARFLILELVRPAAPGPGFDEDLGRSLAALHRSSQLEARHGEELRFGWDQDNFIGPLPQDNRPAGRWSDFYAHSRIEPQVRRAAAAGLLSTSAAQKLRRLVDRMSDRVGPEEPPARLHGDLWSGNLIRDEQGAPCLIDPAVYAGHREIDLAMMRLFGGFSRRTFEAYQEAFPLAPGAAARVPLYQVYPLLVHLNLFGGTYLASLEAALATLD